MMSDLQKDSTKKNLLSIIFQSANVQITCTCVHRLRILFAFLCMVYMFIGGAQKLKFTSKTMGKLFFDVF